MTRVCEPRGRLDLAQAVVDYNLVKPLEGMLQHVREHAAHIFDKMSKQKDKEMTDLDQDQDLKTQAPGNRRIPLIYILSMELSSMAGPPMAFRFPLGCLPGLQVHGASEIELIQAMASLGSSLSGKLTRPLPGWRFLRFLISEQNSLMF